MALSVPLSRFTSRVGGGSAFYVRPLRDMTPEEYKHGREDFWKQFTCGAILGVLCGIILAWQYAPSFEMGLVFVVCAAGVSAFAAGFWGDRFWKAMIRCFDRTGRP